MKLASVTCFLYVLCDLAHTRIFGVSIRTCVTLFFQRDAQFLICTGMQLFLDEILNQCTYICCIQHVQVCPLHLSDNIYMMRRKTQSNT
jgi:hypothetical protein